MVESFTPGPWKVGVFDAGSATIRSAADDELVAECWITKHNRSHANARLIAAAPALLSTAKRALFILERDPVLGDEFAVRDMLRTAIALALSQEEVGEGNSLSRSQPSGTRPADDVDPQSQHFDGGRDV